MAGFGCIRDVSRFPDGVKVTVDERSSLQRHPGFRTQVPLVGHLSSSLQSPCGLQCFNEAISVVDWTREDYDAEYKLLLSRKFE